MKVKPECQHLLTISTHLGLFHHTRLQFDIRIHSPVIVAEPWHIFFRDYRALLFLYVDEILVTGRTREEHIKNSVQCVGPSVSSWPAIKKEQMFIFPAVTGIPVPCTLFQRKKLRRPTDEQVKCVLDAPPPKNKYML